MTKDHAQMLLVLGIGLLLFGIYKSSHTVYSSMMWQKTEGVVVDTVLYNFKCGKQSQCYTLKVGFKVNNEIYSVQSDKKYGRDRPTHMNGKKLEVLYSAADPNQARLTGEFGPGNHGPMFFLMGIIFLIIAFYGNKSLT